MEKKHELQLARLMWQFAEAGHFFRFENDDENKFAFSIIDRQQYPRVWADNFEAMEHVIVEESDMHAIDRIIMSNNDWLVRFYGDIDFVLNGITNWVEENITRGQFFINYPAAEIDRIQEIEKH